MKYQRLFILIKSIYQYYIYFILEYFSTEHQSDKKKSEKGRSIHVVNLLNRDPLLMQM